MNDPVPPQVAARVCPACGSAVPGVITRCPECGKPVALPPPPPPAPATVAAAAGFSGRTLGLIGVMGAVGAAVALLLWSERNPGQLLPLQDGSALPARPLPTVRPEPESPVHVGVEAQRDTLLARIAQLKRRVNQGSSGADTSRAWSGLTAFERKARAARTPAELESLGHSLRDWEGATLR